jgi:hypothetical protein
MLTIVMQDMPCYFFNNFIPSGVSKDIRIPFLHFGHFLPMEDTMFFIAIEPSPSPTIAGIIGLSLSNHAPNKKIIIINNRKRKAVPTISTCVFS